MGKENNKRVRKEPGVKLPLRSTYLLSMPSSMRETLRPPKVLITIHLLSAVVCFPKYDSKSMGLQGLFSLRLIDITCRLCNYNAVMSRCVTGDEKSSKILDLERDQIEQKTKGLCCRILTATDQL